MDDKKEAPKKTEAIFEQLDESGRIDEVIDLFAKTTDEEIPDNVRDLIRVNVKDVSEKLDKMIVILKGIADDPAKKEMFQNELKKQLSVNFRQKQDEKK
jgi:hypothetical protein